MSDYYILEGETVRPVELMEWARWFETADRVVTKERVGEAIVSTVFLGNNHRLGEGSPLIFETMVFGGEHDQFQERCSTLEEAREMHARAVRMVRGDP